jgi:cytoskeletal protein CcmA (bactofilin family)
MRKLIVGRDITLSGEIAACDHLIVEGTVEASVKECHRLEVAESGLFKGAVEINEAEIAGRFEGQITVQNRLSVRSTGRIEGKVQYGELAVDAGGTLDGEVRGHGKGKAAKEKEKPLAEAPLLDQPPGTADKTASV